MNKFNIKEARNGAIVVTRDGQHVRNIRFTKKNIIGVIDDEIGKNIEYEWPFSGQYNKPYSHKYDLFIMNPSTQEIINKRLVTLHKSYKKFSGEIVPDQINWSALGSVDITIARNFAKAILELCDEIEEIK